jgi:hypothetical protein
METPGDGRRECRDRPLLDNAASHPELQCERIVPGTDFYKY